LSSVGALRTSPGRLFQAAGAATALASTVLKIAEIISSLAPVIGKCAKLKDKICFRDSNMTNFQNLPKQHATGVELCVFNCVVALLL